MISSMRSMKDPIEHLYIHVPFCRTICGYCDFCHKIYRKDLCEKWLEALEKETGRKCEGSYKTIYLGGGTPSVLSCEELERLLSLIDPYTEDCEEYTIEVNPESLDEEKIDVFLKHHINRVSMGIQSSDDHLLKVMNRHHTYAQAKEKVELLQRKGLTNISVDLMYSLPFQTMEILNKTLEDILKLRVPHISIYSLTLEENTLFAKKGYEPLDNDIEADMYERIVQRLTQAGYSHYEISNFAKEGYESKHNLSYWRYEDFLGLSLAAASKFDHVRYENTHSFEEYFKGEDSYEEIVELSKEEEMFENVMMSLRTKEGLDIEEFNRRYDTDLLKVYEKAIAQQRENLKFVKGRMSVSRPGILNRILLDFLPE